MLAVSHSRCSKMFCFMNWRWKKIIPSYPIISHLVANGFPKLMKTRAVLQMYKALLLQRLTSDCDWNETRWGTSNENNPTGFPDIILYYIVLYHIILYYITLYYMVSYQIISYYIISYHLILYHIISYHIILYHIISYHIIYSMYSQYIFPIFQKRGRRIEFQVPPAFRIWSLSISSLDSSEVLSCRM